MSVETQAERYARCPQCRGDYLVLTEVHEEVGTTEGRHRIDGDKIIPAADFYFEPGDPVRVLLECAACGHEWRSRRAVGCERDL